MGDGAAPSCRREAWSPQALARMRREECCGHVVSSCHHSHALATTRGVLWCRLCGAYTTRQPRALRFPCPGRPRSEAARNVRARLSSGLLPTTAAYLETASIAAPGPYFVAGNGRPDISSPEVAKAPVEGVAEKSHGSGTLPRPQPLGCQGARRAPPPRPPELDHQLSGQLPPAESQCPEAARDGPHVESALGGRAPRGDQQEDHQQSAASASTLEPPAARRRIRGKSAPPGSSCSTDPALHDARQAPSAPRVAVATLDHSLPDRIARTRYRQLDLRGNSAQSSGILQSEASHSQEHTSRPSHAVSLASRAAPRHAGASRCEPEADAPWTQRVVVVSTAAVSRCSICGRPTRGRCAGCSAACCICCARARRPCAQAASLVATRPVNHHHHHHSLASHPAPAVVAISSLCNSDDHDGHDSVGAEGAIAPHKGTSSSNDAAGVAGAACSSLVTQVLAVAAVAAAAHDELIEVPRGGE